MEDKKEEKKGLVLVYTGKGKGKTTAALGLALRATGHDEKIFLLQFKKCDPNYGEIKAINKYLPNIKFVQTGRNRISPEGILVEDDSSLAWNGFLLGKEAVMSGEYDLVIFDEINVAVDYGVLPLEEVLKMLSQRPSHVDIVLTGRNAHQEIIDAADMVSEVRMIKHHYKSGIKARAGMEF